MKPAPKIRLADVQAVYSGPEARLWELLMGQQIHIGGLSSSLDLAERAGIAAGSHGVDFACCTGAGMRFLLRFRNVAHMTGVDATRAMIELGRQRTIEEGFTDRTQFIEADVCASGLEAARFDFVWGEDAWCYVEDKSALMIEAARVIKPGGVIAFTDWMQGDVPMTSDESNRYLSFMKFPNVRSLAEYSALLLANGFKVQTAHNTARFPTCAALYLEMIEKQLTYDALKIIGFNPAIAHELIGEMHFLKALAESGKIIQGLVVAHKSP
jgi:ubiquinone/menaquinone biosynthesis C-methylase UbiE